ncbi:MAG: CdaR family protein [Muribaculum sp.]|nr:CdaR family protein [Muribaculum sp.]
MKFNKEGLKTIYHNLKRRRWFHNLLPFLGFVLISLLFWFVLAMNDNVQENLTVRINISNSPDTVTFISVPPQTIHITVRDKGTNIFQVAAFRKPVVNFNFRDYAEDGIFRVSRGDFQLALKNLFGPNAQITSSSIDSLRLLYTVEPGKRLPVKANYKISCANGKTIAGNLVCDPSLVTVYSYGDVLDSVTYVRTERIVLKNLEEPTKVKVKIKPIANVRVIPDEVTVTVPIEPLVKKTSQVEIRVVNVPDDKDLLLFPQKAKVIYYVPMSRFSDNDIRISVYADYQDIAKGYHEKLPLHIEGVASYIVKPELADATAEYTIVNR